MQAERDLGSMVIGRTVCGCRCGDSMKVLHVSDTDLMGRRFNGYDLLHDLETRGISGMQAVLNKQSDDTSVISLLQRTEDQALQVECMALEYRHSMNNLLFPWGAALTETEEFKDADVVHLHLVHNFMFSLFDLPRIVGMKPTVWTFHDPWPMTGHCVQPRECQKWLSGCRKCPALDTHFTMLEDRSAVMWGIKQKAYADMDVDVVVASEFMLDMVRRSPLTSTIPNVHLIPFGIDESVFLPDEAKGESRRLLGIPDEEFVILFRATSWDVKGLSYIVRALAAHPPVRPTTLLAVDTPGMLGGLETMYNIVQMGWVNDSNMLARLYSACDVFLMPSLAEAFGLMAVEAMSAGRPVVSFEGTALPGVTHAPDCGIAVPMCDSTALRAVIDRLAVNEDEVSRRGTQSRAVALELYSHDRYLDRLSALYERTATRERTGLSRGAGLGPRLPLAGIRVCLVFEYNLSHYTRIRREIAALLEAGAEVKLLTSHPNPDDAPPGVEVHIAPLQMGPTYTVEPSPGTHVRDLALRALRSKVDVFWVSDFLSLPTVMRAVEGTDAKVVYETVDLVPEYVYHGEEFRQTLLVAEHQLVSDVDGFITACDSYADYYVERYGDVLTRRPVVCDNVPWDRATAIRSTEEPVRFLFFGNLMFDRPVFELLRAMEFVRSDVSLAFQGQNHLGDAPMAAAREAGILDRVQILDPCPPDAIIQAASGYDVGIVALAGTDENERRAATGKIFTYMHAGLAVLGSDLPGIASVVNKHSNGILVPGMEPQAWAEAIDRLAAMPLSEIDAMKQRSLDAAKDYAWEKQKPLFIAEFLRALGREQ